MQAVTNSSSRWSTLKEWWKGFAEGLNDFIKWWVLFMHGLMVVYAAILGCVMFGFTEETLNFVFWLVVFSLCISTPLILTAPLRAAFVVFGFLFGGFAGGLVSSLILTAREALNSTSLSGQEAAALVAFFAIIIGLIGTVCALLHEISMYRKYRQFA